ncbi:hypothetical protein KKB83_03785 [Patescibacteria group bacterium]|nr:hypothetical protein [Patescibacteria group bacterium]
MCHTLSRYIAGEEGVIFEALLSVNLVAQCSAIVAGLNIACGKAVGAEGLVVD